MLVIIISSVIISFPSSSELSPVELPKPKVRKVERKMVPVLEKLSVEELMETNTYQRFNTAIDRIFENTDDLDLSTELGSYLIGVKEFLAL